MDEFWRRYSLDSSGVNEVDSLQDAAGYDRSLDDLLIQPFRRLLRHRTRFSDGTFPVFYSSLDAKTAEAEVRHWITNRFGRHARSKWVMHYQRFSCEFAGQEKDIRGKRKDWPELVHDSDYAFCNRLGMEAVELGLDALVAPSVRRPAGANLPIFKRSAVANPQLHGTVMLD